MHAAATEGFPRRRRLAKSYEYKAVFRFSTRYRAGAFILLVRANRQGFPRLGLAISKRVVSGSVQRNRLKRVAREAFRAHSGDLPAVDIVVLCKTHAAETPNSRLISELTRAWESIRSAIWVSS